MTTSTTSRSRESQAYLDGVAAALADLPEDDRADLLDELATHLDEIAAEGTSPLESRLGTPADYAAELRASAGLPARSRGRAGAAVLARARAVLDGPWVLAARELLVSLAPAWWVLRAWVAGAGIAHLTTSSPWDYSLLVVPGGIFGFWGTLVAIVVSVQIGRGRLVPSGPGWRRAVTALNIFAALALLPVLSSLSDASREARFYGNEMATQYVEQVPTQGVYAAGNQVWNVYAYDAAGQMLRDVRLYDQDGNPISLGLSFDPTKQQSFDASGQRVDNAYPYRYLDPATGAVTDPEAAPPISAPPLVGVPTVTPAQPSPTPTDRKR